MTTSGTTTFDLSILELAEEAWQRASGGASELRSGYDLRTTRRSINILTLSWANKGLNFWTIEQGHIDLTPGVYSYDLPTDTIDLLEAVIRQNSGITATQTDLSISRISVSTYATIPNKLTQGRPIQYWLDRQTTPRIVVWQVPSDSSYMFVYWRMRRIQDAGTQGNMTMDFPFRFLPAFTAGLAFYLAQKIPEGASRIDMLKNEYEQELDMAIATDHDASPLRFVPKQMFA